MEPIVSVVIPIYNCDKYLKDCLNSIVQQTMIDIEIICVDDGSTDESILILRDYASRDHRIKIIQQENRYAGVARNTGLANANGKYIYFIDGDDYCDKNLFKYVVQKAESTNADIVAFDHQNIDVKTGDITIYSDANVSSLHRLHQWFNYKDCPNTICSIVNPVPWNKLFKKSFLDEWKLSFEDLRTTNDITFAALSVACANRVAYLSTPFITHRIGVEDSVTSLKEHKLQDVVDACIRLFKKASTLPHYPYIKTSVQLFIASNLKYTYQKYLYLSNQAYRDYKEQIKEVFSNLPLFYDFQALKNVNQEVYEFVIQNTTVKRLLPYGVNVIVTLTSYPKRIATVHKTIESLLEQNVMPSKIVLYLSKEEFANEDKDLPESLMNLVGKNFEIRWMAENLLSYKKLIPALGDFPDDIIITVDDDLVFSKDFIKKLLVAYRANPACIHCHRVTGIEYHGTTSYKVFPESKLVYSEPTFLHKLCGGAGCLYPPHSLYKDVCNVKKCMRLAPTSDDLWFWAMAILRGTKINLITDAESRLVYVPESQGDALWRINDGSMGEFGQHLLNIIFEYPNLNELLVLEEMKFENTRIVLTCQNNIRHIENSISYRIGRGITAIPRAVRRFYKACKRVGVLPTIQYNLSKIFCSGQQSTKNYDYYAKLSPHKYKKELTLWYERATGQTINIDNPKTFNEKIQWLKYYDSTALKTKLSDKYEVREWISERIGQQYLIPLLGVFSSFDEIDISTLPDRFVMKATHGSAWNIIVRDKQQLDIEDARNKFETWLNRNFAFHYGLELHYKNIVPRIVIEQYIEQFDGGLFDYKVHCFDGVPRYIQVIGDRNPITHTFWSNVYDCDWNLMNWCIGDFSECPYVINRPKKLDEVICLAKNLSEDFRYVRVDFYIIDQKVLFGEMTFTPGSGFYRYGTRWNKEIDMMLGRLIDLS